MSPGEQYALQAMRCTKDYMLSSMAGLVMMNGGRFCANKKAGHKSDCLCGFTANKIKIPDFKRECDSWTCFDIPKFGCSCVDDGFPKLPPYEKACVKFTADKKIAAKRMKMMQHKPDEYDSDEMDENELQQLANDLDSQKNDERWQSMNQGGRPGISHDLKLFMDDLSANTSMRNSAQASALNSQVQTQVDNIGGFRLVDDPNDPGPSDNQKHKNKEAMKSLKWRSHAAGSAGHMGDSDMDEADEEARDIKANNPSANDGWVYKTTGEQGAGVTRYRPPADTSDQLLKPPTEAHSQETLKARWILQRGDQRREMERFEYWRLLEKYWHLPYRWKLKKFVDGVKDALAAAPPGQPISAKAETELGQLLRQLSDCRKGYANIWRKLTLYADEEGAEASQRIQKCFTLRNRFQREDEEIVKRLDRVFSETPKHRWALLGVKLNALASNPFDNMF